MPIGRQTADPEPWEPTCYTGPTLTIHHWSRPYDGERSSFAPFLSFPPVFRLGRSEVKDMRQPDPITLQRVSRFLGATRTLLLEEITTEWLARTLARVDGGPMLDAPRLGPILRMLGFQRSRRRRGASKVSVWRLPGASPPYVGRPRRCSQSNTGDFSHGSSFKTC